MEQMRAILDKIKEYDRIILFRHKRPDGDAIGSTLGLREILRLTYPEKEILLELPEGQRICGKCGGTFKAIGKRFTYGGDTGKDQRVYYFNTKEIMGNKFGTPSPIIFEVMNKRIGFSRTVNVRCNGVYSYIISNPLLFYTKVCGNVEQAFTRDQIDEQMKTEFVSALQPAFGALAELELRPAQIPAKANELKKAMNEALQAEWVDRGIAVAKIALNPITLNDEDMKKIKEKLLEE